MIQLSYTVSPDRSTLTIHADLANRLDLQDLRNESDDWGSCTMEFEVCEHLTSNSELQWINTTDMEDLTDAPTLGIIGEEQREQSGPYGAILSGHDEKGPIYCPIEERWSFQPYQVRSFIDDLLEKGHAIFTNNW